MQLRDYLQAGRLLETVQSKGSTIEYCVLQDQIHSAQAQSTPNNTEKGEKRVLNYIVFTVQRLMCGVKWTTSQLLSQIWCKTCMKLLVR